LVEVVVGLFLANINQTQSKYLSPIIHLVFKKDVI